MKYMEKDTMDCPHEQLYSNTGSTQICAKPDDIAQRYKQNQRIV